MGMAASHLLALVNAVPAVLYEAEAGATGVWFYVSPQLEHLLGIPPSTFMSNPEAWAERIHPDDRTAVHKLERQELELAHKIDGTATVEYRMIHADGHTVWIRDEARLVATPTGEVWRGVLLDVSRKRAVEKALEQAGTQVEDLLSRAEEWQPAAERTSAKALRISCRTCGAVHIATRARRCPLCDADDLDSHSMQATIAELAEAQHRTEQLLDGIAEHLEALHQQREVLEQAWIGPEPGSFVRRPDPDTPDVRSPA